MHGMLGRYGKDRQMSVFYFWIQVCVSIVEINIVVFNL